jgi:AbrB family looped-hinge helix DNA binding protein
MATVTKVGPKYQVVIPKKVREAAGLKPGDLIEATLGRDGIVLKPKVLVDRGLEEALAEAEADVQAGRVSKSYRSARALVRDAIRAGKRPARRARTTD